MALINYGSAILNNLEATSISAASITRGNISDAEFSYLDGVTSAIQTQLNDKLGVSNWEPQEYLQGDIDNLNTNFWVFNTPVKSTAIAIKWNGQEQRNNIEYTVSGTAITFTFVMDSGTAWASYYY